jgi:hypothetical protein
MANLENAQASSAVALRLNPLRPDVFIHQPVGGSLSANGKSSRAQGQLFGFLLYDLRDSSATHPSGSFVNFICITEF